MTETREKKKRSPLDIGTEAKTHKKTWFFLRALFSRTTLLVVFLLIQIYILWAAFTFLNEQIAYGVFATLSILEIIFILNQEGSTAFKIAWIMPIIVVPVFGALFYLFIRLQTMVKRMRHRLDLEVAASAPYLRQDEGVRERIEKETPGAYRIFKYLSGYCKYPCYDNTSVNFYAMGDDFFPVFFEELRKAEHFIFMEFFIVAKGEIWDSVLEILKEKAKAGVEVKFMYDGMNSIKNLPLKYENELKAYGIDAKAFSPVMPALTSYQNNRDHRKICVIDGHTAFTGGLNLADEYANITERFGLWKDTGAMFKGAAVNSFTAMFLQMWNSTYRDTYKREEPVPYAPYMFPAIKDCKDDQAERKGFVIPYGDTPLDAETVGESVYISILNEARDYVYIMTPYLILDDSLVYALTNAAKRGVDVRIMFPQIPDKPYAYWLGHTYFEELMASGVRIYKFLPGFVHAKEFISDDRRAVIGTINLDFRSLYLHFENAVYLYDVPAIADMKADFNACLSDCEEVSKEAFQKLPATKLFFGKLLRVVAPLF